MEQQMLCMGHAFLEQRFTRSCVTRAASSAFSGHCALSMWPRQGDPLRLMRRAHGTGSIPRWWSFVGLEASTDVAALRRDI
jgi:hypothetical protein